MPQVRLQLRYSTYLGGSGFDQVSNVAAAADGGDVVVGPTDSPNFPATMKIYGPGYAGGTTDLFVAKFTANGQLIFATIVGGNGFDMPWAVDLDPQDAIYVVGETDSTNFPTQNPYQAMKRGTTDAFVTKLDRNGSTLVYSTYLGGTFNGAELPAFQLAFGVAVNPQGQAFVAGFTDAVDFPVVNPAQSTNAGMEDAFVTKFTAAGNALLFSTYLGGSGNDRAFSLDLDAQGNAIPVGFTESMADFPTTPGAYQTTFGGGTRDGFAAKYSSSGAKLYATYLGGSGRDEAFDVAMDPQLNAFIIGTTNSLNFPPNLGGFQPAYGGGPADAFVLKLNPTGNALLAATYLGGTGEETGYWISIHPNGTPVMTGSTTSLDFPVTPGAPQTVNGGLSDAFVTWMTADLRNLIFSTYLGGSGDDFGLGIDVHRNPDILVGGETSSPNFPVRRPFQPALAGPPDGFVTRLTPVQMRVPQRPLFTGSDCPPLG